MKKRMAWFLASVMMFTSIPFGSLSAIAEEEPMDESFILMDEAADEVIGEMPEAEMAEAVETEAAESVEIAAETEDAAGDSMKEMAEAAAEGNLIDEENIDQAAEDVVLYDVDALDEEVAAETEAVKETEAASETDSETEAESEELIAEEAAQEVTFAENEEVQGLVLNDIMTITIPEETNEAWFIFSISEADDYVFTCISREDTVAGLYYASGAEITSNDDGGYGNDFRIRTFLDAGTYKLCVNYYDAEEASYQPISLYAAKYFSCSYEDGDVEHSVTIPLSNSKKYHYDSDTHYYTEDFYCPICNDDTRIYSGETDHELEEFKETYDDLELTGYTCICGYSYYVDHDCSDLGHVYGPSETYAVSVNDQFHWWYTERTCKVCRWEDLEEPIEEEHNLYESSSWLGDDEIVVTDTRCYDCDYYKCNYDCAVQGHIYESYHHFSNITSATHTVTTTYECDICGYETSEIETEEHTWKYDDDENCFYCTKCGEETNLIPSSFNTNNVSLAVNSQTSVAIAQYENKWYKLTPAKTGRYAFLSESSNDFKVDLYVANGDVLTYLRTEDDSEKAGSDFTMIENLEAGKTYYASVYGYGGRAVSGTLYFYEESYCKTSGKHIAAAYKNYDVQPGVVTGSTVTAYQYDCRICDAKLYGDENGNHVHYGSTKKHMSASHKAAGSEYEYDYFPCDICGAQIVAENTKKAHTTMITPASASTCNGAGKTAEVKCSVCGIITPAKAISVAGHKAVADAAVAATCTTAGKTAGSHCSVCGAVITSQAGVAAVGHTWGAWITTQKATVLKKGSKTRSCSVCGAKDTADIAKVKATVKLSKTKKTLAVNGTYLLKISMLKTGDAVKSVKSSKKSVAAVKKVKKNQYRITAKKAGKATITVTLKSGKKVTCKITVK